MQDRIRLAMCQMPVGENKGENIRRALLMVEQAKKQGANLAVLPEMFNCPYDSKRFAEYAESRESGNTLASVSEAAKASGIYIVAGSIPEAEDGRLYNTSFVFGPSGELAARHRKLHLFDIDVPGKIAFRESEVLTPGQEVTLFDTPWCRIGLAICYDLRFPELSRLMALKGAGLIILPGAFNMTTGPAHWDILIRARSVDNQVYFAAVSPARDTGSGYVAYGHSMVSNPWGEVIARAGEGEELVLADMDLKEIDRVRRELPLLSHRRTDIYSLALTERTD